MTIDVIIQGTSREYTIGVRHQTFVVSNNSGQYGLVSNYTVEGIAQPNENIGPQPGRVSLGPFLIGDTFTATCDIGQLLVEYDNVGTGGGASQAQVDSIQVQVNGQAIDLAALNASQAAQDTTIAGLSTTVSGHTTSINTLNTTVSSHTTSINTLTTNVATNTTDIDTLEALVSTLSVGVDAIPGTVGDGVTNNATAISSAIGLTGTFVTAAKVTATVGNGGVYKTGQFDVHPSVSLDMKARGGILIQPDGDISSANADGAEASVARILRRTPSSSTTLAWGFMWSGANIDGRGVAWASGNISGVNTTTDTLTSTSHGRPNGFCLVITSTGTMPGGLVSGTRYFVINAATNTFQLSATSGGSAIDITSSGSGTITWATQVHGIRVPNADPSNNPLDPDPSFAGNKDYVAGRYEFGDAIGLTGTGLLLESTNGRADIHSFRGLNNDLNGIELVGNDVTLSGHWAVGGNKLTGLKVGNASGCFGATGNLWGNAGTRSLVCQAMWINQRKLYGFTVSEFNDWCRFDGGNSYWRGGVIGMCSYAPFNEIFDDDGVAFDFTTGGADTRLQYSNGVTDYWTADFIGNKYSRTTATNKVTQPGGAFATWMNVGGDLAGNFGTAFRGFIDASSNAMVNTIDQVNSGPNVKPWTGPQAVISAVTVATPGVFTSVAHGLSTDQRVALTSSTSVPGGLFAGVTYFVIVVDADTFQLANIPGQTTGVTTTSSGSGTIKFGVLESLPYSTRGGGQVNYLLQDSFNGETRIGAKGGAHSRLLLGVADDTFATRTGVSTTFATADVDTANNKITSAAHGLKDNYPVKFTTTTTLPGGLSASQQYWVVSATTNDFKVAELPGGAVVDITSVGSGTHTFHSSWRVYAIEMGDRSAPSSTSYRHAAWGLWELAKGEQYMDTAWVRTNFSGGTFAATVGVGTRTRIITLSGGTFSTGSITLPTDLNASQFLDIVVWGQVVTAFSLAVSGAGSINTTSTLPVPTTIQGQFLAMKLFYERDQNRWDVLSVSQPAVADIAAKIGSGAAVTLTSNTIANLTSIVLTPGLWDVTGNVIFTSAAATTIPTIVSAALSTASTTIPATDATSYGKRLIPNTVAIASGTDYETVNLGTRRESVAAGTTTTIYLNGRSTFTGAGASATAFGALRAVPANG